MIGNPYVLRVSSDTLGDVHGVPTGRQAASGLQGRGHFWPSVLHVQVHFSEPVVRPTLVDFGIRATFWVDSRRGGG